jgi:hypothetical protein
VLNHHIASAVDLIDRVEVTRGPSSSVYGAGAARPTARAASVGLNVIGTIGILLAAKQQGFLTEIRPELDRLLSARFFMDHALHDRAIGEGGE